ncbi:hypothetical protein ACHAW6_011290 [Cyclotella cf. meneghiniana]
MVHAFQPVVVSLHIILSLQFSSVPAVGFRLFRVKNHSWVCHHRSETPPCRFSKPIYPSLRTTPLFTTLEYLDDSNMNSVLFFPSEGRPRSALVDACAVWCGPCKLIEPFLAKCAEIHLNRLSVLKYDVEAPNTKNLKVEMLLQGIMIRGLPTLVIYHDGVPLATHSGAISETALNQWLEDNLFAKIDDIAGSITTGDLSSSDAKLQSTEKDKSDSEKINESGERKRGFINFTSYFERDDYAI